jgi:hypothetical protein
MSPNRRPWRSPTLVASYPFAVTHGPDERDDDRHEPDEAEGAGESREQGDSGNDEPTDGGEKYRLTLPPDVLNALTKASQFRLPPTVLDQIQRVNDATYRALEQSVLPTVASTIEQLQRSFAASVAPRVEQWQLRLPKMQTWLEVYGPKLAEFANQVQEAWRRAKPPNWADLEPSEVTDVIRRVEQTGYCLVWIPRTEILREVLESNPANTARILSTRSEEVLDDCLEVLTDVGHDRLTLERDAVAEAIRGFRNGYTLGAQALAASVFTSTITVRFQTGKTSKIKKEMLNEYPEDAGISQLRLRTIFLAGGRALDDFRPDTGWPIRTEFNRHNTAHRITAEQWTPTNALSAIMLTTALLREIEYWLAVETA